MAGVEYGRALDAVSHVQPETDESQLLEARIEARVVGAVEAAVEAAANIHAKEEVHRWPQFGSASSGLSAM